MGEQLGAAVDPGTRYAAEAEPRPGTGQYSGPSLAWKERAACPSASAGPGVHTTDMLTQRTGHVSKPTADGEGGPAGLCWCCNVSGRRSLKGSARIPIKMAAPETAAAGQS